MAGITPFIKNHGLQSHLWGGGGKSHKRRGKSANAEDDSMERHPSLYEMGRPEGNSDV